MLNPLNFISKFIKSSNQRELDKIAKIVKKINSLEEATKIFGKAKESGIEEFPGKTIAIWTEQFDTIQSELVE